MPPIVQQNLFLTKTLATGLMTLGGVGLTSFGCVSTSVDLHKTDNDRKCVWTRVNEAPTCEDVMEPQVVVLTENYREIGASGHEYEKYRYRAKLCLPDGWKMAVPDYRLKVSIAVDGQDTLHPLPEEECTTMRPEASGFCPAIGIEPPNYCRLSVEPTSSPQALVVSAELFVEDAQGERKTISLTSKR